MFYRLKEIRKMLGISQLDFAKHLGITQTVYSMIEHGHYPLEDKYIQLICSKFNVNESWLYQGQGDMFLSSPHEKEVTEIMRNLTPTAQQYLLLMAKELLNMQTNLLDKHSGD